MSGSAAARALSVLALWSSGACGSPSIDVPAPFAVVQTSPSHGAVGVGVGTACRVGFNHPLDPGSVEGIALEQAGEPLTVIVRLADDDRVAELLPERELPLDADVDLVVQAGVTDLEGTPLGSTHVTRFHTAAER